MLPAPNPPTLLCPPFCAGVEFYMVPKAFVDRREMQANQGYEQSTGVTSRTFPIARERVGVDFKCEWFIKHPATTEPTILAAKRQIHVVD